MGTFKKYLEETTPDQMQLDEMTSVSSRYTGLGHFVWVSSKGGAKHGPRIKVSNTQGKFDTADNFSMSVSLEPEIRAGSCKLKTDDLESVKDWIRLNHEHLQKVWHSDTMDSGDHLEGIQKI
jgi:hypothetical protein